MMAVRPGCRRQWLLCLMVIHRLSPPCGISARGLSMARVPGPAEGPRPPRSQTPFLLQTEGAEHGLLLADRGAAGSPG